MESIKELLKKAAGLLRDSGNTETPILDAELLLIHVLNQSGMAFDRIKLVTQQEYLLNETTVRSYQELVEERSKGKPIQYITQSQEFMGIELYVSPGVLIPRGDTEVVVEKVIDLVGGIEDPYIIDMCTGSGAIAVSLAKSIPGARVLALDISDIALECCRTNVSRLSLEDRVRAVKSDIFGDISIDEISIDVIVSNPPYIESAVIKELGKNVREYEPHLALDGGEDGLVYYKRIVKDGAKYLRSKGVLVFEIGYDQGAGVKNIMEESGYYEDLNIEKDLAGYDRCVWGRRI